MTITLSTNIFSEYSSPNLPHSSRLRRLGQLRPYPQNYPTPHCSSGHRSYGNTLSRTAGLPLPVNSSSTAETALDQNRRQSEPVVPAQSSRKSYPCTEGDRLPISTRVLNSSVGSLATPFTSELLPHALLNDPDTHLSEEMAKHR